MSNPAPSQHPAPSQGQPAGAPARSAETDSAVEFLTALVPAEDAVRRRAFAALLRAVTREVASR